MSFREYAMNTTGMTPEQIDKLSAAEGNAYLCRKCDGVVEVGSWPFCPHGKPNVGVINDELEGGPRFFETMGDQPVYIESKSQWRREVAARNLEHVDRHDRAYYQRKFREHDERIRDERRA